MGTASGILAEKREEVLRLARIHGATGVRVFGSIARGDDRPDSDVDLLVDMEEGRSLLDVIGLWLDLQELLGRKVDVLTDGALHPLIRDQVLAEAKPL